MAATFPTMLFGCSFWSCQAHRFSVPLFCFSYTMWVSACYRESQGIFCAAEYASYIKDKREKWHRGSAKKLWRILQSRLHHRDQGIRPNTVKPSQETPSWLHGGSENVLLDYIWFVQAEFTFSFIQITLLWKSIQIWTVSHLWQTKLKATWILQGEKQEGTPLTLTVLKTIASFGVFL